jgi:AAA+ superfamily predicted ATPase
MALERITSIFENDNEGIYKILFGPGVDDIFINPKLVVLKFEEAFFEELHRQGFDRIVFYSPHRSVFFFDTQSEELSRPGSGFEHGYHPNLTQGPLEDLQLFRPIQSTDSYQAARGMGDVFAVRMLDTILRDISNLRSAVVILQSESSLHFFEDQRTLAGLIGEWTRLPSSNPNRCYFIFSAENFIDLTEVSGNLPVPELRNAIIRNSKNTYIENSIFRINTPDVNEIQNLIRYCKKQFQYQINEQDLEILSRRMASENQKCRYWQNKLSQIQMFDLTTSRRERWFEANLDLKSVWDRLDELTGLEQVKIRVRELVAWLQLILNRQLENPQEVEFPSLHMVFSGGPGTGKTTIARMIGEIFYEIGYLRRGHLVETNAADLIAEHVGGTAIKTNLVIDSAMDGVLFIDEAYALTEMERGGFGMEAIESILMRMENDRQRFVVIAAGYPEKMDRFRKSNPGLERRFPVENVLFFEDFSVDQLNNILVGMLDKKNLVVSESIKKNLFDLVTEIWRLRDENFGNAGEIRNLVEGLDRRHASRVALNNLDVNEPLNIDDVPISYRHLLPQRTEDPSEYLKELENLVGLEDVKAYLRKLIFRLEYENLRYEANPKARFRPKLQHMVFRGNPGTGKTTIARLIGRLYKALGLLRRGHCVEVTRVDLVAGYVGQTAEKTFTEGKGSFRWGIVYR